MPWGDSYLTDPRWVDVTWMLAHAENPLVVLRVLTDARTLSDEVIEAAVLAARERGDTWEQIAEALRVSRQAAHARYAENHEKATGGLDAPHEPHGSAEPPSD